MVSPICLRTGASIGAGAVVVAGNDVGRFATVGAGAVVTRDVPDYALVAGNPARRLGWVCACGRRLVDLEGQAVNGASSDTASCPACGVVYDIDADELCASHDGGRIVIPISKPDIGLAEEEAVLEVLRSGMLAMGRRTAEFEEAWAAYCGVRHAVLMSNGTVALEAVLRALGIGPGDEVITVSFTFNATVSAILQAGARPVFVDIRADDFCMDPDLVEAAITPAPRRSCRSTCTASMRHGPPWSRSRSATASPIIEDAAQALGRDVPRPPRGQLRAGDASACTPPRT